MDIVLLLSGLFENGHHSATLQVFVVTSDSQLISAFAKTHRPASRGSGQTESLVVLHNETVVGGWV